MNKKFLRIPKVIDRIGYSRSSIYALMAQGRFPRAYSLGGRAVAWLEQDVDDWIESRVSTRGEDEAA